MVPKPPGNASNADVDLHLIDSDDPPTWVYTALCSHGQPLYVGVSKDVSARIKRHRETKHWWARDVWTVTANLFPTRTEALRREAELIRLLLPHWNIAGRPSRYDVAAQSDDGSTDSASFDSRGRDMHEILRAAR